MNLTLVAFYGSKPDPLVQLVDTLQTALRSELGPAFSPYAIEQVHATILGLEGWRVGEEAFNAHMVEVTPASAAMDLRCLLRFMQALPPFQIRIGGFTAESRIPFTSCGMHPHTRSFALNGSSAVMIGWPVTGDTYPMTLDSLRRDCRQYNVLHKYYQKEGDVDNDLFLVLGRVDRKLVSDEKSEFVQEMLRQLLAGRKSLDLPIHPDDLSVVAYTEAQLPPGSSVRYSIPDALTRVEELNLLFSEYSQIQLSNEGNRMRILVLCGDAWHPPEIARKGLEPLVGMEFTFDWMEDARDWSLETMAAYRLVILTKSDNVSVTDKTSWMTDPVQSALSDYVMQGNGLLAIHSGTAEYDQVPVIRGLLGGVFLHHPEQCLVTVSPHPDHPLSTGIAPFTLKDEHYFMALDDPQADVFMTTSSMNGEQPGGWRRDVGDGRVAVLTPGHNLEVWLDPSYQVILSNCLRWCGSVL